MKDQTRGWVAGLGALVGGFLVYVALAGMGGGLDLEDRLTFDQSGELELEGIGILVGLVFGVLIGAPAGVYLGLRLAGAPRAGITAFAVIPVCALVTILAFWAVPSGPSDPVLAPYFVFGGWFVAAYFASKFIGRR